MNSIRRYLAFGSILGLIAVLTSAYIWGEPAPRDPGERKINDKAPRDREVLTNLDGAKFAELPVITYTGKDGTPFVAIQIKPTLAAVDPRPRDYTILVSTSASMAQGDLPLAQRIIEKL